MKFKLKQYAVLASILILAFAAFWIVYPNGGSKIDLRKIKIPFAKEYKINLGLDLQGGSHLVYQADFKDVSNENRREALEAIRGTIERRVNSFGVSEPLVQIEGSDKIIIELPGIKDIATAKAQIGQTPLLEFKTQNPNPPEGIIGPDGQVELDTTTQFLSTGLSGKQLKTATADIQQSRGLGSEYIVRLEFDEEGKKLFTEITQQNLGKQVAIFLDGQILSAPTVQSAITDGIAVITGDFDAKSARDLAGRLNSGALPVPIKLVSEQTIGATLGQESIQQSLIAGIIGLILIALFMLIYYRAPGFLAVIALLIYTLLSLAVFKIGISITAVLLVGVFFFLGLTVSGWFGLLALLSYILLLFIPQALAPVTLTLAGIAGFILSIGMAVDANILIFERFREEVRAGKDIGPALDDGFKRAWLSIRDSNVSSLITTIILYMFGTPAIKGFAVTLGIGILISMFTAITITRTFLKLLITDKIASIGWLFGVKKPNPKS
jgi:preprotein translocase subunit SecD